jgi:predicted NUDIX family NTP pyrophosphohydrolase
MPSHRNSAGILVYKIDDGQLKVFLVHPGGPFWKNKDAEAWTIPKGEFNENESALEAAIRELKEETGHTVTGNFIELESIRQKSGKTVFAWAIESDMDPAKIRSNHFEIEWPPRSGKKASFPEVDKAAWFTPDEAREKILPPQWTLIEKLKSILNI